MAISRILRTFQTLKYFNSLLFFLTISLLFVFLTNIFWSFPIYFWNAFQYICFQPIKLSYWYCTSAALNLFIKLGKLKKGEYSVFFIQKHYMPFHYTNFKFLLKIQIFVISHNIFDNLLFLVMDILSIDFLKTFLHQCT